MSGGRVELGLGAGWFDAEHAAYGIPFPPTRRALRPARGAARDHHRPVGDAGGRDRSTSTARTTRSPTPRRCPSRCSSRARRSSSAAAARSARRAWPPGTPTSSTCRFASVERRPRRSSTASAPPAPRPAATRAPCAVQRAGASAAAATTPRSPAGPPRSVATPTSCAQNGLAGTPAEVVDTIGALRRGRRRAALPPGARPGRPRPPRPGRRRGAAAAVTPRGPTGPPVRWGGREAGRPVGAAGGQRGRVIPPGSRSTVSNRPSRSLSR